MDDIFDQTPPGEHRPHVDTHKLIIEARAELNAIEKSDESSIEARREIGRKFKQICDAMVRGGPAFIAKHIKHGDEFVRRHIELAEAPDYISTEDAIAIIWGHKKKEASGGGGGSGGDVKPPAHPKLWKAFNHLDGYSKALANSAAEPDAYDFIAKHMKAIEKKLQELETKVGQ